jgi:hypothetical protein
LLAILSLSQSNGVRKGYIQDREIQRDKFQFLEGADGGLSIPEGLVFADRRKSKDMSDEKWVVERKPRNMTDAQWMVLD